VAEYGLSGLKAAANFPVPALYIAEENPFALIAQPWLKFL
jgi:hypothetical protein